MSWKVFSVIYGTIGSIFSILMYLSATNTTIAISSVEFIIASIVLISWLVIISTITMFSIVTVSPRTAVISTYVVLVNTCILIPISFSVIYRVFQRTGSCLISNDVNVDIIYYSYSTLTTLVYGDIKPVELCRYVSVIESIAGYISLGVLVALLIALIEDNTKKNIEIARKQLEAETAKLFEDGLQRRAGNKADVNGRPDVATKESD